MPTLAKASREVDPAALPRCADADDTDGIGQAAVGIADDELDAVQATAAQRAQERCPELFVLRVLDIDAEDLAMPSAVTPVAITTARDATRPFTRALQ